MEISATTQLANQIMRVVDAGITLVSPHQVRREDDRRKTKRASDPDKPAHDRAAETDSASFSPTTGAQEPGATGGQLDRSIDLLV